MLRFIYVILLNLFRAPYMIPKMRREADHPEKYSAEERYELARHYPSDESYRWNSYESIWTGESSERGRLHDVPESSGQV